MVTGPGCMGDGPAFFSARSTVCRTMWATWGQAVMQHNTHYEHASTLYSESCTMVLEGSTTQHAFPHEFWLFDSEGQLVGPMWTDSAARTSAFNCDTLSPFALLPVLLSSLWLTAGVSCTQPCDHLWLTVFAISAMNGFHMNSHMFKVVLFEILL
jgi:hypothetical protein